MEIQEGELFGLLGPNGAGKTTLISVLATILRASRGSATVCGHNVAFNQPAIRRKIGIVFQDPSLDDELTGWENLDFHGRLYGLDNRTRRERILEVLSLVELVDRSKDLVRTYSGGMKRRLEMARGLIHRPRVLFLDEPTLGLDPQTRRKIWNYVLGLKNTFGMTVILTTHYMEEAERLCDRIAIIDHGQIVAMDSPESLKANMGGDLLEMKAGALNGEFLSLLREAPEVASVSVGDETVLLSVERGESFIPLAFEIARKSSVQITAVSLRKPNLEDVFIDLTGREMRDDSSGPQRTKSRFSLRDIRK